MASRNNFMAVQTSRPTKDSQYNGLVGNLSDWRAGRLANSFGEILRLLKPQIPAALLDGSGWDRIVTRADSLSPLFMDAPFGFELRLDNQRPEGDLLVCVPSSPTASKQLAEQEPQAYSRNSSGHLLKTLLSDREDPSHDEADRYFSIILEYDVIGTILEKYHSPGVFLSVIDYDNVPNQERIVSKTERRIETLYRSIGRNCSRQTLDHIRHLIDQGPDGSFVAFVGAMPDRGHNFTRVNLAGCDTSSAVDLLKRIFWSGDIEKVNSMLSKFQEYFQKSVLAIDIGQDGLSPRIGVELSPISGNFTTTFSHWMPLFEQLLSAHICHPSTLARLERFPRSQRLFTSVGVYQARFGINHIKIVFGESQIYTKAYVAVRLHACD